MNDARRWLARSKISIYSPVMTVDEIKAALRASDGVPTAALAAGMAHAGELAPAVVEICKRFCQGTYLLPSDNNFLFYGLQILAAARQPGLCEHVMAIARQPSEDIDRLFPDYISTGLARLLLSSWDQDPDVLFAMIEQSNLDADVRWALFDVLARLTFDGRIPKERTVAFLARIERDGWADDTDMAWWGWEEAVVNLGLAEFEPALRRVWEKPVYNHHGDAERTTQIDELHRAANNPGDPGIFDVKHIQPIDDPVEAVAWIERRATMMAEWDAARAAEGTGNEAAANDDTDPAKAIRLTRDECDWLEGFLVSRQVPETTMPFEMLDGFFTALVIGPVLVPPSQYLPVVWGTEDGEGPIWDSTEQAQHVTTLLMKHWNAIAARRAAHAEHLPIIEHFGISEPAADWATGFTTAIDIRPEAWEPIFADRRADQLLLPMLALSGDAPEEFYAEFTVEMRNTVVENLPVTLQMIDAYWRNPKRGLPRPASPLFTPVRTTKVGRNDPCPCGSGQKFKKCCGSASSSLH